MPIIVRPAAAADIDEAFVWYERQRPGLGDEFLAAVQSARDSIATHPAMHPVIHRDTRRALVHRFPATVQVVKTATQAARVRELGGDGSEPRR